MNAPFFAIGYAQGDIVRCVEKNNLNEVVSLEHDSGNGTIRLYFSSDPKNLEKQQAILNELVSVGCTYERATENLVAVTVPPTLEFLFSQVANYLNGINDKVLDGWEIGKRLIR